MSFTDQDLQELKAESLELLDAAEKSLLALDEGAPFTAHFDSVFRAFHSIKGAAGMMEQTTLERHTHQLETILVGFKQAAAIPKDHINLFLRGIDAARAILDGENVQFDYTPGAESAPVQPAPAPSPVQALELPESAMQEFVSECEEIVERVSAELLLLEKGDLSNTNVNHFFRDVHSLKGSAYLFSFNRLGDIAHGMESSLDKIRNGTHRPTQKLVNLLFESVKLIEQLVDAIKTGSSFDAFEPEIVKVTRALALHAEHLEPVAEAKAPDTAAIPAAPAAAPVAVSEHAPAAPVQNAAAGPASGEPGASRDGDGSGTIRVPVPLLDHLMTLVGEMVLVRNQVIQFSNRSEDPEFLSMSKRLNVVTSEIQGEMMKTRMQPLSNVVGKFNRVVRDLSQELKKNIQLVLTGAETELDKSLLEAIKDPLTHIVRNSCDHGIEPSDVRRKSGKPDAGTIQIKSYHEGGQVVIEVTDDGKGLNPDVLVKKGIEKGLVTQTQAAKMTEKEIFDLIFAPGFSTAAAVTSVSGRGVGMDVVRTNIERIGGTIDLSSKTGAGTSIKIKIPLTLAIVPALIVRSGDDTFAIPQLNLEELVRVDSSAEQENRIEMLHGAPVYRLRGSILPLIDLNQILGIASGGAAAASRDSANIAVLSGEQGSFGLIVDEVLDTADIVVKPINRLLKSIQVYAGATVLGDGTIGLILDVPGLARIGQIARHHANITKSEAAEKERQRKSVENQDFLLFQLASPTKHAIPLSYVNRLEEFPASSVELSGSKRVIRYRNSILPLVSANEMMDYGSTASVKKETLKVIVIQRTGSLFGIEVDDILDTLSTPIEADSNFVTNPAIFGNLNTEEELIVVLDPFALISKAFPESFKQLAAVEEAPRVVTPPPLSKFRPQVDPARPKKILLVEDTAFFRKAIRIVLEKSGFEVHIATDGQDAIEILNRQDTIFDMVISDIEMPRMNGFQLASTLRNHPVHSRLPLLAVSSRADRQYLIDGKKAGFDIYLEKLKPNLLLSSISELLDRYQGAA